MIATPDIDRIIGAEAVDPNNDKIGKVSQVYIDADTEQPTWASVKTGLFGTSETLVPLENANWDRDVLRVGVEKARVKDAPRVDPDAEISPDEQERLYSYYGLHSAGTSGRTGGGFTGDGFDEGPSGPRFDRGQSAEADVDRTGNEAGFAERENAGRTAGDGLFSGDYASRDRAAEGYNATGLEAEAGTGSGYGANAKEDQAGHRGTVGHDTSGPTTDDAMTRSEERLNVGTQRVQTGKARLRKYVVTEERNVTVPVTREEVRLEREPVTGANVGAAMDGPDLSEEEHEVVLNEERPVVEKETVPVERVRLDKEQVTENQQVSADVAHEEISTEGDRTTRGTSGRI